MTRRSRHVFLPGVARRLHDGRWLHRCQSEETRDFRESPLPRNRVYCVLPDQKECFALGDETKGVYIDAIGRSAWEGMNHYGTGHTGGYEKGICRSWTACGMGLLQLVFTGALPFSRIGHPQRYFVACLPGRVRCSDIRRVQVAGPPQIFSRARRLWILRRACGGWNTLPCRIARGHLAGGAAGGSRSFGAGLWYALHLMERVHGRPAPGRSALRGGLGLHGGPWILSHGLGSSSGCFRWLRGRIACALCSFFPAGCYSVGPTALGCGNADGRRGRCGPREETPR